VSVSSAPRQALTSAVVGGSTDSWHLGKDVSGFILIHVRSYTRSIDMQIHRTSSFSFVTQRRPFLDWAYCFAL